jgi:hypothetical protein
VLGACICGGIASQLDEVWSEAVLRRSILLVVSWFASWGLRVQKKWALAGGYFLIKIAGTSGGKDGMIGSNMVGHMIRRIILPR